MNISSTLAMELIVSLLISFTLLFIFIWAAKNGQFDDNKKLMNGLLYDSEDDLNEAVKREKKKEKLKNEKLSKK